MGNEAKTLLKNGYIFILKLYKKKGFVIDLKRIVDKWTSLYQKNPLGYAWDFRDLKEVNARKAIAHKQRLKFVENLQKNGGLLDFRNDINLLIEKYGFGKEWFPAITDYVISLWLYPPPHNLAITEDGKNVVLTLNPDTSLDDMRDAWTTIKTKQKELHPNFKKINLTKQTFKDLYAAIEDLERKKFGNGFAFDSIKNHSYKKTDLDIVGELWANDSDDISEEADKRRAGLLRQKRRRFKTKQV